MPRHDTTDSVKAIVAALRRLEQSKTAITRRNARNEFLACAAALRSHVDKQYPVIREAKPSKALPFSARFTDDIAKMFVRLAGGITGRSEIPNVKAQVNGRAEPPGSKNNFNGRCINYSNKWDRDTKWRKVLIWLDRKGWMNRVKSAEFYRRFHTEIIPTTDLQLAAEHLAFLQSRGVQV